MSSGTGGGRVDEIEVSTSDLMAIAEQVRSRRGALPTSGPTGVSRGASVYGAQVLADAVGDLLARADQEMTVLHAELSAAADAYARCADDYETCDRAVAARLNRVATGVEAVSRAYGSR